MMLRSNWPVAGFMRRTTVAGGEASAAATVYLTGNQTPSAGATVAWDASLLGTGWWSAGAPTKFVVPSGVTLVRLFLNARAAEGQGLTFRKNGVEVFGMPEYRILEPANFGWGVTSSWSAPIPCSPGDEFTVVAESAVQLEGYAASNGCVFGIEALDPATVYVLAKRSSNQAIGSGGFFTLEWNAEELDAIGAHDNATNPNRFTIPTGEDGYWETFGSYRTLIAANSGHQAYIFSHWFNAASAVIAGGGAWQARYRKATNTSFAITGPTTAVVATDWTQIRGFTSAAFNLGSNNANYGGIIKKPVGFKGVKLLKSATQDITNQVQTWATESYDTDGAWAIGNPTKIIIPAGVTRARFKIGGQHNNQSASGALGRLRKNGSDFAGQAEFYVDTPWSDADTACTAWLPVTPGDEFTFYSDDAAGGTATWQIADTTFFEAEFA